MSLILVIAMYLLGPIIEILIEPDPLNDISKEGEISCKLAKFFRP